MEPIEPPWQAIKEWIPDEESDLEGFNRPRNPSDPDPEDFDQPPTWKAPEIQLGDGRPIRIAPNFCLCFNGGVPIASA